MVEALKEYLKAEGYSNVFLDFMPKDGEAISLYLWSSTPHVVGKTEYIQIQVRRSDYLEAKQWSLCCSSLMFLGMV